MAKYLVTGGAGFIGSHLVEALARRGDQVRVLDDLSSGSRENLGAAESAAPNARIEFLHGSITDMRLCQDACRDVDGVLHEAAQVSVPRSIADPQQSYDINVIGTLKLLEAARQNRVRKFVFAASSAAYGDTPKLPKTEDMPPEPLSPYAAAKLGGEQLLRVYAKAHGMRTISLRYFNVFGPRQADDSPYTGVIALFARALLTGKSVTIYGDGEQTRDFTYVDDVVRANLLALDADIEPGIIINIGSGERVSVNALYAAMAELVDGSKVPTYERERLGDVRHSLASIEKAGRHLGYAPRVSWREGLERTFRWYQERFARRSSGSR